MSASPVDLSAAPVMSASARAPAAVAPAPVASPFAQTMDPAAYTEDAAPFPPAVLEALAVEPDLDACEERAVREGSDQRLLYVPWVHYQRVLIAAFGRGGFRLVPRGPERTQGNVMTWKFALFVRTPGQPHFQFVDESVGECNLQGGKMSAANAAEGAKSDALVKCCKRLGIFDHLWDPNWRRAWEHHHRGEKRAQVNRAAWPVADGVSRAGAKEDSTSGRSTPGEAPSNYDDSSGSSAGSAAGPGGSDTGEPASGEQKEALKAEVRRLGLKAGYLKLWMAETFGLQIDDVKRVFEALSQQQADSAYLLLKAHGMPLYPRVVAELKAAGKLP